MIIIEGTDAVGKTSTIEELKKENINCFDRSKDVISKYMVFDYSFEYRAKIYYELLNILKSRRNEDELKRRVLSRKIISEFDLQASLYNELYKETFYYMQKCYMLENKLFLVDVTHLTLEEQVAKVKEIILDKYKNKTLNRELKIV